MNLARPLAATKFEIRISKYETISNDKKLNALAGSSLQLEPYILYG